jgi:hypothetical protein
LAYSMRLDWNDIKARAAKFAADWKDAYYERGETQTFYNEFFELFGVTRRRVASFEHGVDLPEKKRGYLDLFWKGKLLVEQKSAGRKLTPARKQALDYFPGLKEHELPRYILLSDFQNFELYDLDIAPNRPLPVSKTCRTMFRISVSSSVKSGEFFAIKIPANIDASELTGALHDALDEAGYRGDKLERFLVRLLFCLFADDTGIFQPLGIFEEFLKDRTREDGADLGPLLSKLFEVLDTPEEERGKKLDADLARFSYVNGELFHEHLLLPDFDRAMRDKLLYACGFNWEKISPAIFGSLFQSVTDKTARRKQGGHYTSEKNILKVIEPLFLDDLKGEFARLKARKGYGPEEGAGRFSRKTRRPHFFRSGLRLRKFFGHRLSRIARTRNRGFEGTPSRRAACHRYWLLYEGQCRSILRDRDFRVPRPHRRGCDVDDGPHHERAAVRRLRRKFCAHSLKDIAEHFECRRAGDGLGASAGAGKLFLHSRKSAVLADSCGAMRRGKARWRRLRASALLAIG